jgi:hypothetical protein
MQFQEMNNFKAANMSTKERILLRFISEKYRLPVREPNTPPTSTTSNQRGNSGSSFKPVVAIPSSPVSEFRKINKADTADASLGRAYPPINNIGVRRIPPPIPMSPEIKPMISPTSKAT